MVKFIIRKRTMIIIIVALVTMKIVIMTIVKDSSSEFIWSSIMMRSSL